MSIQRFIAQVRGVKTALTALVFSTGPTDGGKIVATDPLTGKLDLSVMPTGVGSETDIAVAETGGLTAGDLVHIYNNSGALTAQKADATIEGHYANGFVLNDTIAGNNVRVYRPNQTVSGLTNLELAGEYYLDIVPGMITLVPPSTIGNTVQYVGLAVSTTTLVFNPSRQTIVTS